MAADRAEQLALPGLDAQHHDGGQTGTGKRRSAHGARSHALATWLPALDVARQPRAAAACTPAASWHTSAADAARSVEPSLGARQQPAAAPRAAGARGAASAHSDGTASHCRVDAN
jgi:hypothetical protein